MLRPSPVPLPTSLVVKNGSTARAHVGGHAAAIVRDRDANVAARRADEIFIVQDHIPCLDFENTAVRHGVARVQSEVEQSRLQLRRVHKREPRLIFGSQQDLATPSDRPADEPLELPNEAAGAHRFWVQSLSARKSKEL